MSRYLCQAKCLFFSLWMFLIFDEPRVYTPRHDAYTLILGIQASDAWRTNYCLPLCTVTKELPACATRGCWCACHPCSGSDSEPGDPPATCTLPVLNSTLLWYKGGTLLTLALRRLILQWPIHALDASECCYSFSLCFSVPCFQFHVPRTAERPVQRGSPVKPSNFKARSRPYRGEALHPL